MATLRTLSHGALLLIVAQGVFTGGCAGSAPKPEQGPDVVTTYHVDADDQPKIVVDTAPGVVATAEEKEHFTHLLSEKIDARRLKNAGDGNARPIEVHVTVTKFDKGSKFARAMLAGLGQIHLDATIVVTPAGGGAPLDKFSISKTFAWGGIYGASEGIEDVEPGLADGIAAALTGQSTEDTKAPAAK
jgi:hypothetical protein